MRLAALLVLAAFLLSPVALAERYDDPVHDEVIGFPPGPALSALAGCQSPSGDIVGVSIEREGGDIVTRVTLLDRDAPLACGPVEGAWLTSSAYLDVYTEDLSSSMTITVDSIDPEVGDPNGNWRVTVALYVGEHGGASLVDVVPASELWQGDTFETRIPAAGVLNGIPYDATGLVMQGYVEMDSWTNWPTPGAFGGFPQRAHDRAEIPRITL